MVAFSNFKKVLHLLVDSYILYPTFFKNYVNLSEMLIILENHNNLDLIIRECKKKNEKAYSQLYKIFYKKIFTTCVRYLKDQDLAHDLTSEIFIKIFDKISLYKEEISFENWLIRLTINTLIDYIRKNKLYKKNYIQTKDFDFYGEPYDDHIEIEEIWETALNIPNKILFELIRDLPPVSRLVFNLYVIDEFSHKEISQKLNISEGTSKWHLSNARKILKKKIYSLIKDNELYVKRRDQKYR